MRKKAAMMLMAILLCGVSCGYPDTSGQIAQNSILDLRDWDFEKQGMVNCSGPWKFYWGRLLPSGGKGVDKIQPDAELNIPGSWIGRKSFSGHPFSNFGYATLRLDVLFPSVNSFGSKYKISTGYIGTSYRLIIVPENERTGRLLLQAGRVGTTAEESRAKLRQTSAEFTATGKASFFLQVSNFEDVSISGPLGSIRIGTPSQINTFSLKRWLTDFFLMGAILMIGIYNMVLFLLRREEKPPLLFGMLCFLMCIHILLVGTYLEEFVDYDNIFQINMRVGYLVYFTGIMVFALFMRNIFPRSFSKNGIRLIVSATVFFSSMVLVLPISIFSHMIKYYNYCAIAIIIWCIYGVFSEAIRTRGAISFIILLATTLLSVTALHDILYFSRVIRTRFVLHYGIAVFILLQSLVVAIINASSRKKAEELAADFARERASLLLTEKQLQRARNYLHNVFNSLPSILFSIDGEEKVTEWNMASEKFSGVNTDKAVMQNIWELVPPLEPYKNQVQSVIRNNRPLTLSRVSLGSGDRHYDIAVHPLSINRGDGAVIRIDDITEKMLTDDKLQQAQNMDTIGNLVGGLSHDFNNILGAIIGTISLMKRLATQEKMTPELMDKYLSLLRESADRARDVIQQLLSLSSRNKLSLAPVDLNLSIKHVVKMCESSFDKNVIISTCYHEKPATILADPVQIEQMLLNLCVNSFHAMTIMKKRGEPQGGELRLSVERTKDEGGADEKWCITVSDTGVGINREIQHRIFDPFFTTKSDSGGTGLGLAMAYAIINRHNGNIEAESEPGRGTAMRISFPVVDSSMLYYREIRRTEDVPTGKGRILVIDDEILMRETAREMLVECGYDVVTAGNGLEGANIYRYIKDEIDLVLLNIIMPQMSGYETYLELKKIKDTVSVIVTSGLRDDYRISMTLDAGANSFMPKPFSLTILAQEVDRVLKENEGGPKDGSSSQQSQ